MTIKKLSAEGRFESGLDDIVRGKVFAFTPIVGKAERGAAATLGVAVANEPGYLPIPTTWCHADSYAEMRAHANELNKAAGLDEESAARIVCSTMAAQRA